MSKYNDTLICLIKVPNICCYLEPTVSFQLTKIITKVSNDDQRASPDKVVSRWLSSASVASCVASVSNNFLSADRLCPLIPSCRPTSSEDGGAEPEKYRFMASTTNGRGKRRIGKWDQDKTSK